jgi:DNA repair protein RecO (recombination protein O)
MTESRSTGAATGLVVDHAVVLRWYKLGETDRILVLLTAEHGKVRAVAKGLRKPTSKMGGALQPLSHVKAQLWHGRSELWKVTQAQVVDSFKAIRGDLDKMIRAGALVEAVDQLTPDGDGDEQRYRMLLGALRHLDSHDAPALLGSFMLKLLAADGVAPDVDFCVGCGTSVDEGAELVTLDLDSGGFRCRSCRRGMSVDPGALDLTRRVLGGELNGVLAEPPSAAVHDLERIATVAMEHHVERRLRTVAALAHLP